MWPIPPPNRPKTPILALCSHKKWEQIRGEWEQKYLRKPLNKNSFLNLFPLFPLFPPFLKGLGSAKMKNTIHRHL